MDDHLNQLTCSKYIHCDIQHFVKEPIRLPCRHVICKSCLPANTKLAILCNKCGCVSNDCCLDDCVEALDANVLIKSLIGNLFNEIEKQASDCTQKLKDLLSNHKEAIEIQVRYIEEEIEIRIESMKIHLDEIYESFKIELAYVKLELEERTKCYDIEKYENNLNELKSFVNSKETQSEESFYKCQNELISLKKMIKKFEEISEFKANFKYMDGDFNKKIVGEICYNLTGEEIIDRIRNRKFDVFELYLKPTLICHLPNYYWLCANSSSLLLYDDNFNVIRQARKIGSTLIRPNGIAVSHRDEIYISDYVENCIIQVDLNLNKIKSFGSLGPRDLNKFNRPCGMCCTDDRLYVCDTNNLRVQIFTLDLEYVDTLSINDQPTTIQVSSSTIGVCCTNGVYFYDLHTKLLKAEYSYTHGRISRIDSLFYIASFSPRKLLYIFDEHDESVKSVDIHRFDHMRWEADIIRTGRNLFIFNDYKILKF